MKKLMICSLLLFGCKPVSKSEPPTQSTEIGISTGVVVVSHPIPMESPIVLASVIPTVPSTSTQPTASGKYSFTLKNMSASSDGWFKSNNLGKDNACYAQARLNSPVQPGQTSILEYEEITNVVFDGKKNLKTRRSYKNSSSSGVYPNDYDGQTVGSKTYKFTVENGDGKVVYQKNSPNAWNVCYYNLTHTPGVKQHFIEEVKYSSANGKPDGHLKITVDGVVLKDAGGLICNGPRNDFGPQMVNANPGTFGSLPAGSYYNVKIISLTAK